MKYKLNTKKPHILCLILLISFPSVATVLISPALPAISTYFTISTGFAQQLITLAIIGYALGQLVYAPLANRFGRKNAIYIGIALFLISCCICLLGVYIHRFELLLLGFFLMTLGASVGMVMSFTIINDFYHPEQARPIVAYTVLAYAFMPGIAIAIAGLITNYLRWVDCFYFYLLYGLVILIVASRLPETLLEKNKHALKVKTLVKSFLKAFTAWRLVLFSLIYGLLSALIYIIASEGSFIGIKKIGLNPGNYGLLLLISYFGQFLGALIAGKISKVFSAYKVMGVGYTITILGSLWIFINFAVQWITAFSLIAPLFFVMMGLPMIYSSITVMALIGFSDKATGSATMTFITMGIVVVFTYLLTALPHNNPIMMPSLFLGILLLASLAFWHAWVSYADERE